MRQIAITLSFIFISNFIFSQPCINVNQLNINTAFDPNTNLTIAVGTSDSRWIIDNANNIPGATNNTSAIACIPSGGSASNPFSSWIGFATSSQYVTNNPNIGFYNITFRFPFRTCLADSLFFNMNIANDNYISDIRVDGITTGYSQPVSLISSNWQSFSFVQYSNLYAAGYHFIEIDVINYNVANAMNPHELNLYGTVNSNNNSIVNYNSPINCVCNVLDTVNALYSSTIPIPCDSTSIQFNDLSTSTNSTITNWQWDFGDGNTSNAQNPIHNYVLGGSYLVTLIVTNNLNHSDTFSTTILAINNGPTVTAIANPSNICIGASTTLTGSGADVYVWSGTVTNGVAFYPTSTSTYTVIGTDANGCTATSSVTVTVNTTLLITVNPPNTILCIGDSINLNASGASNFTWSPSVGLNTTTGSSVWANPSTSQLYTITGSDPNGCSGTTTASITVVDQIDVKATKNRDVECKNNIVQLQATGATNYTWTPTNLVSNPSAALTNATVNQTTTFYVTGTTGSCVDVDSIVVYNYNNDASGMFIPSAFSPNGDGVNDCLQVKITANFSNYYFGIYNRWGELVFESDNPNDCWNGEYKNSVAPLATYYYYLKATTLCGEILKKGDILLMR